MLVDASADYLARQLQAGVDAVQIFDTWAGVLPPDDFERWCDRADQAHRSRVRARVPDAKDHRLSARRRQQCCPRYVDEVALDAVSLDWMIDPEFARDEIQARVPVQGNLDPLALRAGGAALDREVDAVLEAVRRRALHLQSRPRHSAGHADRPCRADAQARAGVQRHSPGLTRGSIKKN